MKAMIIEQFGGPEVFKQAEVPTPTATHGHVVIRVAATSVNPIDTKIRSGAVPAVSPSFPAVLHGDVVGTVEAVGEGVKHLSVGDEVYACAGGVKGSAGALAELMLADADLVVPKPAKLSVTEAAALPLVGITAWEALIDRARIQPSQRVLVHGGAGGVGHIGVQLAKAAGAIVYTTVYSETKADIAKRLGADVTINYREHSVADYVEQHTGGEGFDVVFDTVGGDNLTASFAAARPSGVVVTIAGRSTQDLTPLHGKNLTLHCEMMLMPLLTGKCRARHGRILRDLARLVETDRLGPLLDPQQFGITDVVAAHRKLEAGEAVGKIVLVADF